MNEGVPTFVGRDRELACLGVQLERARAGEPRLVFVEGPEGIGKTALVRRFLARVGDDHVLRASGEETESSLLFGVLDQLALLTERHSDPLVAGVALIDVLGELQRHNPLVLVVDDAQWADAPSLQALSFALRRIRDGRVLVIVLIRHAQDARLTGGACRMLARNHGLHLRLDGLSDAELRELGAKLGVGRLLRRSATRLREHTGGNPLYVRALLEELTPEILGDPGVPLPAPRSVAARVLARLASCSAETQQLVGAASVLGATCPLHLAGRLAALDDPLSPLEQAVSARLLQERPSSGPPQVTFPDPLVHAAVYHELGPARRACLHGLAVPLVDDDAARVRHRLRAAAGPDPQLGGDVAEFARRQAAIGRWDTAADHLGAAAQFAASRAEWERLAVEALDVLLLAGRVDEATAFVARLPATGDPALRSYALGRLTAVTGRVPEAEALLADALRRCEPGANHGLAARTAGQLAMLCALQARGADAVHWASQAAELAPDQVGSDYVRFAYLAGLGMCGEADRALTTVTALPDHAGASLAELGGLLGRGLLRMWVDDLAGAERDLAGLLARQDRSVPLQLLATSLLGQAEYRLGRWDDALQHASLAISLAELADQVWLAPLGHALTGLVAAARGHWDHATAHVDAALDGGPYAGYLTALTCTAGAQLAAARGDAKEVVIALRPLLERGSPDGCDEPGLVPWQDLLVDALISLGEQDQAEAILLRFERLAAGRERHSAMALAARARGNLRAASHDHVGAAAAFEAGLEHAAQVTMPFERARLQLAYGASLRRASKRMRAAEQLEAARATLAQLGARPYLERCERELATCGRTSPARRLDSIGLTTQERAVARLAASGLTNRQVAQELAVSVKTVEYHLGHVYAKLRVTSRTQLAHRLDQD